MPKYLLFFGQDYYPKGGMNDCIGKLDNLSDAVSAINEKLIDCEERNHWAQVYDIEKEIVLLEVAKK